MGLNIFWGVICAGIVIFLLLIAYLGEVSRGNTRSGSKLWDWWVSLWNGTANPDTDPLIAKQLKNTSGVIFGKKQGQTIARTEEMDEHIIVIGGVER